MNITTIQPLIDKVIQYLGEQECNDEHNLLGTMGSNLSMGNLIRFLDLYEKKLVEYFDYSEDVYEEALNTMPVPKILRLFNRITKS